MATVNMRVHGKAHAEKYHSTNPVARYLVNGFLSALTALVDRASARDIHEIGCGEGHICAAISMAGRKIRGTDISPDSLAVAREELAAANLDVTLKMQDLYTLDPEMDAAELVICCEVLEHVENPSRAMEMLAGLARPWLIVSVPREPVWCAMNMARGKYLSSFGNTPGHLNHWTKSGFIRFVSQYADVIEVHSPLPWTMLLCRRRGNG